ncbi:hypothetical protein OJ997_30520 [Solirubrobacter phytolaccae]|uniref:Uncharacterized protein n=1 Tax=Solirubrobacter phytolaccae TaxID=1404360 RepID=A0A9X3NJI2_9ACTN|nr:hypothetical protein [Solirubrobacter phytolaccae]MDA0184676.1 hypothetical protein [Solirubrobacter phytolaccae]
MDSSISDDDDWPVRAIVVVLACLAGAVAALESLIVFLVLVWADDDHGNLNPDAALVLRGAFYVLAPAALVGAILTWELRWRRVARIVTVLVAVLGAAGWWLVTHHV